MLYVFLLHRQNQTIIGPTTVDEKSFEAVYYITQYNNPQFFGKIWLMSSLHEGFNGERAASCSLFRIQTPTMSLMRMRFAFE